MRKYTLIFHFYNKSRKPVIIYNSKGEMIGYTQRFRKNRWLEIFFECLNYINISLGRGNGPFSNVITKDIHGNVRCKITVNNDCVRRQTWSSEKIDLNNQKITFGLYDKYSPDVGSMRRFEYEINGEKIIFKVENDKGVFRNSNQEILAEVIADRNKIFNKKYHVLLYSNDADVFEFCSIVHVYFLFD
ncbi:hypothetical protein [Fervidibacillus halotolerans]|uniref:Tubby C-terminal domain-containing protein n=1 Tax=Fervidibacillus halotolerans TaxID=2980027 RepID=A0A9E8LYK7_9BACI|nr:hypothetical protein [Fervidibacillus halotolerans]WAA11946.1 hypothetical protein OE105_10190 [Fervidibacillus halotolerans]